MTDERTALADELEHPIGCKADFYALWCDDCRCHPSKCKLRAALPRAVEGKVFEARNRGNTFGRFVQDTLRKAVDEESALSHPNTGGGK